MRTRPTRALLTVSFALECAMACRAQSQADDLGQNAWPKRPALIYSGRTTPIPDLAPIDTAMSFACSLAPQACANNAAQFVAGSQTRCAVVSLFLEKITDGDTTAFVAPYGADTCSIRIDDFLGHYQDLAAKGRVGAQQLLGNLIAAAHQHQPPLAFGITLYEDEIPTVGEAVPSDLRERVDTVYLYLHYRASGPDFPVTVRAAQRLFPNARMIGGAYVYDRHDYVPCEPGGKAPCTPEQEISFFESAFREQIKMANRGELAGIELYPTAFETPDRWRGWQNPKLCKPNDVSQCVAITRRMISLMFSMMKELRPPNYMWR